MVKYSICIQKLPEKSLRKKFKMEAVFYEIVNSKELTALTEETTYSFPGGFKTLDGIRIL